MTSFLSRRALARVVTSLLKSEMKVLRLNAKADHGNLMEADEWPEDLEMVGNAPSVLNCDSLDLLRLSAAVNEMFHLHEAEQERNLLSAATFADWLDSIQTAWALGVARVTFNTSGSTGKPKRCTHEFSHLETEISYLADVFADRTRVIPLTPAHHIYGFLFTAMLPDRLGHPARDPESAVHLSRSLQRGDLVVSFPERWQWLHRTLNRWPEDVAGVVSTAPCPPDLKTGLMERGLGSLTEIYGSSETAGLGIRRWPDARYHFMPHWRVHDVSVVEGTLLTHSSGLKVRINDHLELHGDHSFTLAGRIDAAVQVGGINVYPKHIAELIREQPGVGDAVVRLGAAEVGGRLKAFVVPQVNIDPAELQERLERWTDSALTAAERPKSWTFGSTLPKSGVGKDCDW